MESIEYVEAVLAATVKVASPSSATVEACFLLGATHGDSCVFIPYADKSDLARALAALQRLGVPFLAAGPGWAPADVYADLRDEGSVQGQIATVAWRGPNEPVFSKA